MTTPRKKALTPTKGLIAKKAGIYAEVEKITPDMAQAVLDTRNVDNRPINRHQVETIADQILSNEFTINGQTVSFDTNNNLHDGQQRLSAIARAGVTVEALVVYNIDPATRPTVDVGRKRTVADEFTMRGEKNSITQAAILMMLKRIEMPGSGRNVVLTTVEAIKLLDENPRVREAAELAIQYRVELSIPSSVIGYCMMKFRDLSVDDDTTFWEVFSTGMFDGPGDPRFVLQKTLARLARNSTFSTSAFSSKVYLAAIIIKAWNAYREGREIQLLRYSPKVENFPEAI